MPTRGKILARPAASPGLSRHQLPASVRRRLRLVGRVESHRVAKHDELVSGDVCCCDQSLAREAMLLTHSRETQQLSSSPSGERRHQDPCRALWIAIPPPVHAGPFLVGPSRPLLVETDGNGVIQTSTPAPQVHWEDADILRWSAVRVLGCFVVLTQFRRRRLRGAGYYSSFRAGQCGRLLLAEYSLASASRS